MVHVIFTFVDWEREEREREERERREREERERRERGERERERRERILSVVKSALLCVVQFN